jgi:hypothetical protein
VDRNCHSISLLCKNLLSFTSIFLKYRHSADERPQAARDAFEFDRQKEAVLEADYVTSSPPPLSSNDDSDRGSGRISGRR